MAHFLRLFWQCNRIPEERRYALPLKSIYMKQIDHMVGLFWMRHNSAPQWILKCRLEKSQTLGTKRANRSKKAKPRRAGRSQAAGKVTPGSMRNHEASLASKFPVCAWMCEVPLELWIVTLTLKCHLVMCKWLHTLCLFRMISASYHSHTRVFKTEGLHFNRSSQQEVPSVFLCDFP